MKNELDLIADGLVITRDSAWAFAKELAVEPSIVHSTTIMLHDMRVAALGTLILHPPKLIADAIAVIAAAESRDIVKNIETLDAVANTPAPITPTAAAKI
jgi:hypothetical protein